jgi:hypothetical protein
LKLTAQIGRKINATCSQKMQVFRLTLSDGSRKFHTALQAPDATAAETKAAYFFDTSEWRILTITHVGAVA